MFFGGRSPEHDVSVISGLQALNALDPSLYDAFPVYIAPNGAWYVGDALRDRRNYLLNTQRLRWVKEVTLDMNGTRGGILLPKKKSLFGGCKPISFEVALLAFHGLYGEDGNIQGMFEVANVPYTGMRTKASAILMDKVATKHFLKALNIPVLPFSTLKRPQEGYLIAEEELKTLLEPIGFPCIIKPSHLGSSIGVAKIDNVEEAKACLPAIFEYDDVAIAEPFVNNLVEYNVAVAKTEDRIVTSAIEKPKTTDELLDFKQKYMSGSNDKTGNKLGGNKMSGNKMGAPVSEGLLSLTRDINPDISADMDSKIRDWAVRMFEALDGTGAPRIDCIGNSTTGELWMNEVNPCPGSFGYFLWEASKENLVLFTDLLTALITEALSENASHSLPHDPVPADAQLFRRG